MFKKILSVLFLFVLLGTLIACKSKSVLLPTTIESTKTITTKEVVRDTVFEIKKDSSYYKAWLECQDGKVTINNGFKPIADNGFKPIAQKGTYLQPPKVIIKDNILTVNCEVEAQKLFAQWKDVYTIENAQSVITNTVEVERELTGWQNFQLWCGRILLLALLLLLLYYLALIFKKT
ncbi:hypothetical protein QT970_02415 [Microcoleus sp. herbarium8]